MSFIDEPTTSIPTGEELALLLIEQGKQLLREARAFSEDAHKLRIASIETAFHVQYDQKTGRITDVVTEERPVEWDN